MAHHVDATVPPVAIPASEAYYDLGLSTRHITTSSRDAQAWFDRGLAWCYSFNHGEAVRCFHQVVVHDPRCAMGYWGLAFASGPNYNKKWSAFEDEERCLAVATCYDMTARARELQDTASPVERALIDALRHRFPSRSAPADFAPWVRAYADAMRGVYREFGADDADVVAITADALMNTKPWNLFDKKTRKPNLATPVLEARDMLEHGLERPESARHPGILHMYIHLMEMSETPEAAADAADRLRGLVPDSGHMCHMPSHIDVLTGDYVRAIEANQRATLADDKFFARHGGYNFYSFYRLHNYHSLIYAAMQAGRWQVASSAVARMEATVTKDLLLAHHPPMANWMEYFVSVRVHMLIRFGRWEDLKRLQVPHDEALYCVTTAGVYYGRGVAYAATGDVGEAERQRRLYVEAVARVPRSRLNFPNRMADVLAVGTAMLDGEIAYRRGNTREPFRTCGWRCGAMMR